jgi:hypothetical protein
MIERIVDFLRVGDKHFGNHCQEECPDARSRSKSRKETFLRAKPVLAVFTREIHFEHVPQFLRGASAKASQGVSSLSAAESTT